MTLRKLLKIAFGLLIFFAVAVGLTSINHPIILKWVTGSAKHHGKPMPASVYANGQLNDNIKLLYSDQANNYLLCMAEYDSSETLTFINIDLNEKQISKPTATTKTDYDLIAGHLFQSKTAVYFSPFQDIMSGLDFNAQLSFSGTQIKFNLPSNKLKLDSLRIILP